MIILWRLHSNEQNLDQLCFYWEKLDQKTGKSIANVDFNKEPRNESLFLVNYFVLFLFPLDI